MKGNTAIIDSLNKQLTLELTSMDQYLAHSKMYEDFGLSHLHHQLAHEYDEELTHAQRLIERILFLEGTPDTASREPLKIGQDVPSMLQNDLDAERVVAESLRNIIALCETERDYVSRDMLLELLSDTEEDHIYLLEKELGLIDKIGLQNFLQSKM